LEHFRPIIVAMSEIEQRTLYEEFFGGRMFVYPLGEDGKPDYGSISFGNRTIRVVNVTVFDIDGKRVESLELETGNFLPGREIFIDG